MKHTITIFILLLSTLLFCESSFDHGILFGSLSVIGNNPEFNLFESCETNNITRLSGKLSRESSYRNGIGFYAFKHFLVSYSVGGYKSKLVEKNQYTKEIDVIQNRSIYLTVKYKKVILNEVTFFYGGGVSFDKYNYKSSIESINYGNKLTAKAKKKRITSPCVEAMIKLNLIKQLNLISIMNYNFNYDLELKLPAKENHPYEIEGGIHTFKLNQFKLNFGLALDF